MKELHGIDTTLADIANRHAEEVRRQEREEERRRMKEVAIFRAILCVPCAIFAFWHIGVFLDHGIEILKAAGVIGCLLMVATTWEYIMDLEDM